VAAVTPKYKPCDRCAEERASGDVDEALKCFRCKGTGYVRTPESYQCNKCGGPLCPAGTMNAEHPHGLVEAVVDGGYDSPALTDCTLYMFSICEKCLREFFDSCKVPPRMGEYSLGGDRLQTWDDDTYEQEAARYKKYDAESADSKKQQEQLRAENRCHCGEPGKLNVVFDENWHMKFCDAHWRDIFAYGDAYRIPGAERLETAEGRRSYAHEYYERFMAGEEMPMRADLPFGVVVATSVLLSMILRRDTVDRVLKELGRLHDIHEQPKFDKWVDARVPMSFDVGDPRAEHANGWLAWGHELGFREATAVAKLGEGPEYLFRWGKK
jgi:hypothetical protein